MYVMWGNLSDVLKASLYIFLHLHITSNVPRGTAHYMHLNLPNTPRNVHLNLPNCKLPVELGIGSFTQRVDVVLVYNTLTLISIEQIHLCVSLRINSHLTELAYSL